MRQVGDRLIPVGVTSGRVHAIDENGEGSEDPSGRRPRRRNGEILLQGMTGQDLEEVTCSN